MITAALLDQITVIIGRAGLSTESVAALREAFRGQHFTYCLDDEVGAGIEPYREAEGFNIYLVNGSEHCIAFTRDPQTATGLVLAEVTDDD